LKECGNLIGCGDRTIMLRLIEYGIPRRGTARVPGKWGKGADKYLDSDWLQHNYIDLKRAAPELAHEAGCCKYTILKWLKHYGIPARINGEAQRISPKSHACKSGPLNPMFGRTGSSSPAFGKIHRAIGAWYLNPWTGKEIWLRSSWERRVADYLFGQGIEWIYEPKTFRMGEITYTPDFYLPKENKYIEVKGWMPAKSKLKIDTFNRWHPEICLEIWDSKKVTDLGILSMRDTKIKLEF
jgi:hypothetical protein